MIVSWNWLKEYVRLELSVDELVDRLMMAGLNHESTAEVDGDLAIDLEVTSNRPDCLGHLGIAREIAVLTGQELKLPTCEFRESERRAADMTDVVITPEAAAWCPQYRARVIEGVKVAPSPLWMQRRLRSVGMTPINNVVDITNYVLLESGQPQHAFDFDKLQGRRIVVRNAKADEKLKAINNREYRLAADMAVIADAERAVALAGIMGGSDTEVSDQTTTVLLETAEFAPLAIRRTSRALDLSSDASYRFERRVDPAGIAWASDRACHLLEKLAGGRVAQGYLHAGSAVVARPTLRLRASRIPQILGIDIPPAEVHETLTRLGCEVSAVPTEEGARQWSVTPPTFRRDLTREIDLIEEVGRIHGYAEVSETQPLPLTVARQGKAERVVAKVREALTGFGYGEAVTFSFTDHATVTAVSPWTSEAPLAVRHSSRKLENKLRQSLIPSLLRALSFNEARGNRGIQLYELAHVFLPRAAGLPEEPAVVGGVSQSDFRVVRGHVESLLARLHVAATLSPTHVKGLDPDRTAQWHLGSERLGVVGYVEPTVRDSFEIRSDVVAFEILLAPLVAHAQLITRVEPLPDQPSVERDLAVVFDEAVRWAELEAVVRSSAGPHLRAVEFVDLYRGKQVPAGKKSIAFRLTYRAEDRTLTREEVDAHQQEVIAALGESLGGVLRS